MKTPFFALAFLLTSASVALGQERGAVLFSVTDKSGQAVRDLRAEDFALTVSGKKHPIASFLAAGSLPVRLVLLVDKSGSRVDHAFPDEAFTDFFRLFLSRGRDQAAVVAFASAATLVQDFTDDAATLETSLINARTFKPWGGTALYDSILLATSVLGGIPSRRALVVVSDGVDNASKTSEALVRSALAKTGVHLYAITPNLASTFPSRRADSGVFQRLAENSGGFASAPRDAKALAAELDKIGKDITAMSAIVFESPIASQDGKPLKIRITTSRKGLTVRHPLEYQPPSASR